MSKMSKSTINNMNLHNVTGHQSQQINYDMKNATSTSTSAPTNATQHNKEFILRNGNHGKSNRTTKVSIASRKCSSINPYRIFILLVIGFPGINNGKFTFVFLLCKINYVSISK